MEKFIPYEKLSKKEKRKMDLAKRQTWGNLSPVTRKPQNSNAYKRTQSWKKDLPNSVSSFCDIPHTQMPHRLTVLDDGHGIPARTPLPKGILIPNPQKVNVVGLLHL